MDHYQNNISSKNIESNEEVPLIHFNPLLNSENNKFKIINVNYEEKETPSTKINDNENKNKKEENHRRSKKDFEGRTFNCEICGKSYLSYAALYTHRKQKHNINVNNGRGKGRGRPKKNLSPSLIEKLNYNPTDASYFKKDYRNGITDDYNNAIKNAFLFLYDVNNDENKQMRNLKRKIQFCGFLESHDFLFKYYNNSHKKNNEIYDAKNEKITIDDIFIEYLNKVSNYCNNNYFEKIIIFVTLFREFINQYYKEKIIGNEEFTTCNNAEDIPDLSNDFILEFINPDDNYNDFGFSRDDCIDLIQNLCYWMYNNNFTCSKLSIIQNNEEN